MYGDENVCFEKAANLATGRATVDIGRTLLFEINFPCSSREVLWEGGSITPLILSLRMAIYNSSRLRGFDFRRISYIHTYKKFKVFRAFKSMIIVFWDVMLSSGV
jgi:hypothetical protein